MTLDPFLKVVNVVPHFLLTQNDVNGVSVAWSVKVNLPSRLKGEINVFIYRPNCKVTFGY